MLGILRTEAGNRKCSTTVAFGIEAAVVLVGDGRPQSAWSGPQMKREETPAFSENSNCGLPHLGWE